MFLRSVLFIFFFATLDVAICAPAEKEKIDPVDLNYYCFSLRQNEKDHDKSPILLIHGLTGNQANWDGIYEILALDTKRRVCAVDLRNHGDTPWNNRSDVEAMTVDIEHFLDERKIQKVNLIGHSLGGKIAVHFSLKNPDRVDSLVVEDMRPNGVTPKGYTLVKTFMKLLQEAIKAVPEGSSEDDAKKAIIAYLMAKIADLGFDESTEGSPADFPSIRFVDGKWQYKMNLDVLVKALDDPEEFLTPSSGIYNGPAMFIYGTKSIFDVAGDESNIRKLFPKAQMIPVEGAGHVIHGVHRKFVDEVINLLNNIN